MLSAVKTPIDQSVLNQRCLAILRDRYRVKAGQRALVLYDEAKTPIGKGFAQAARRLGASVDVFRLNRARFTPQATAKLFRLVEQGKYNVFANLIEGRVEEAGQRIKLVSAQQQSQQESGGTLIHCPKITTEMLGIEVDYGQMSRAAEKLTGLLLGSGLVRIVSPLGTDLRLEITGRQVHDDVTPKDNDWGNFPCGEVYCAPIESSANGRLIADGSVGSFGLLPYPLKVEVQNGKVTTLSWLNDHRSDRSLLDKITSTIFQDAGSNVIAELGIGLAPYSLCGNMLQDEKVGGTVHIAFGDNSFFGGQNSSNSHVDMLVKAPGLSLFSSSGQNTVTVLHHGRFII